MLYQINERRPIGIVGGMGPRASLLLHERVINFSRAVSDADHPSIFHLSKADIPDRTDYLLGRIHENPAMQIVKVIQQLHVVGAGVIGIPCNTSHVTKIYSDIEKQLNEQGLDILLINMINETLSFMANLNRYNNRVGLISTNGAYHSGLYTQELEQMGYELVHFDWVFQNEVIHRMIYDPVFGIKSSSSIGEEVHELLNLTLDYLRSKRCKMILLGCTEFSILPKSWLSEFDLIDPMDILANSLLRYGGYEIAATSTFTENIFSKE